MSHSVAPGAANKNVIASWVGVGGGWKRVVGRWVGVGGVWKQFFEAGYVQLLPATVRAFANSPDVPIARLDFADDGTVTATYTDHTVSASQQLASWHDPISAGAGAGFQIRANRVAGEATVLGSALGAWIDYSAAPSWRIEGGGPINGGASASLKVDIRVLGGTTIIASTIYLLSTVTFDSTYSGGFEGREGGINRPVPFRWDV